ncbi:hypothetical protein CHS0354_033928 [Potamilus streckersoni]|uniref:Uncharacterized protein n=1 Tax=Potamilus streckersoni TaxID=2493646 RepID=A0AAE0RX18_9BIVA|nr:hypothetical protein CHS0354_033928 [Potamilus streckersoni]
MKLMPMVMTADDNDQYNASKQRYRCHGAYKAYPSIINALCLFVVAKETKIDSINVLLYRLKNENLVLVMHYYLPGFNLKCGQLCHNWTECNPQQQPQTRRQKSVAQIAKPGNERTRIIREEAKKQEEKDNQILKSREFWK